MPVGLLKTPSSVPWLPRDIQGERRASLEEMASGNLFIRAFAAERQLGRLSRWRHSSSNSVLRGWFVGSLLRLLVSSLLLFRYSDKSLSAQEERLATAP